MSLRTILADAREAWALYWGTATTGLGLIRRARPAVPPRYAAGGLITPRECLIDPAVIRHYGPKIMDAINAGGLKPEPGTIAEYAGKPVHTEALDCRCDVCSRDAYEFFECCTRDCRPPFHAGTCQEARS